MLKVDPPPTVAAVERAPESDHARASPVPPSGGRRSRPEAPVFSFSRQGDSTSTPPESQHATEPASRSARENCVECNAVNPVEFRFCVTCGAPLQKAHPNAPSDASPGHSPTVRAGDQLERERPNVLTLADDVRFEAPAAPDPDPFTTEVVPLAPPDDSPPPPADGVPPMVFFDSDRIIGAPVVDIAATGTVPAKLVMCSRCRGHCVAGTRFCKYCGGVLEDSPPALNGRHPDAGRPDPVAPAARGEDPPTPVLHRVPDFTDHLRIPTPRPAAGTLEVARAAVPREASQALPRADSPPDGANAGLAASPPLEPRPAGPPRPAASHGQGGRLVVIVEDGSEGRSFSLADGQLDIGRTDGDIVLEDDLYVSPRHARLRRVDGRWVVRDLDSTNHVYARLRKPHILRDGDLLLLGLEVLQFQTVSDGERGLGHAVQHGTLLFGSPATPRRARLCQRTIEGITRDVYHLFRDETVIGREVGDVVFTADPFLSRRHVAIRRNPVTSEFALTDLDSSNGTYVAIRSETALADGDFLRIGQHLFRVDLG